MVLIYTDKKTKIKGNVINPKSFSGKPAKGASIVYTDDKKIKEIYENINIKVKGL